MSFVILTNADLPRSVAVYATRMIEKQHLNITETNCTALIRCIHCVASCCLSIGIFIVEKHTIFYKEFRFWSISFTSGDVETFFLDCYTFSVWFIPHSFRSQKVALFHFLFFSSIGQGKRYLITFFFLFLCFECALIYQKRQLMRVVQNELEMK